MVQVVFIAILFGMLIYWHYLHRDSLEVVKDYEKQLLDAATTDASTN